MANKKDSKKVVSERFGDTEETWRDTYKPLPSDKNNQDSDSKKKS